MQREIDAALPRAVPLRPLLEQFRNANRGMAAQTPSAGYALYLVAVNPAVVVGVPLTSGYGSCNSPGWTKCFYAVESRQLEQGSARHSSFVVYYNSLPPVRDGSFVLVPEWQTDSVPLPADRAVTTLGEKAYLSYNATMRGM